MAAGKEIKRLRGKRVTSQEAADFIGVNVDRLRKWEERNTDPHDTGDIAKVEAYFGLKLSELHTLEKFEFVEKRNNSLTDNYTGSTDKLLETINLLVRQHDDAVKTNKTQSETIKMLAEKTTAIPVSVPQEIHEDVDAKFSDLLEVIAELGTGTRWKSKKEALAVLSKLFYGKRQSKLKEGIQNG